MQRSTRYLLLASLIVAPAFAGGSEGPPDPPPDLLRGPDVGAQSHASNLGMLGSGAQRQALQRDAVPVRQWFVEFNGLALTSGQRERFTQLREDFQTRSDAFKKEHGKRQRAIRSALKAIEQRDAPAEVEQVRALQDEQAELQRQAPKVELLQKACWGMLTPGQQDHLRTRLAEIRAEIRKERMRKQLRKDAKDAQMQDDSGEGDPMMQEDPAERLRRLMLEEYD